MYGCVFRPDAYGWTDSCLFLKAFGIALDGGGCLLCFCVFLPAMSWAGFAGFVVGSAVGLGLGSGCLGRFSSCMGFALLSFFEVSVAVLDSVDARGAVSGDGFPAMACCGFSYGEEFFVAVSSAACVSFSFVFSMLR